MNDHDAMDAINAVLDQYFRGEVDRVSVVGIVCQISGQNSFDHEKAKKAQA